MAAMTPAPRPRLSAQERKRWRRALSNWQTPDSMIGKADALSTLLGQAAPTQAGLEFFREAFVAGRFASAVGAEHVRLVHPDPRPDFELRTRGQVEAFELVEADTPGRRRGEAYAEPAAGPVSAPEAGWLTAEGAAAMLATAAAKKADGRYDRGVRLLIHLNPTDHDAQQAEIETAMKPATAAAANVFAEVWVFWKDRPYRVW